MADTYGTSRSMGHIIERLKRGKKVQRQDSQGKAIDYTNSCWPGTKIRIHLLERYIRKIKSEFIIIEKLLNRLRGIFIFVNIVESEAEVEKISKEVEKIGTQVDIIIEEAEAHV